MFVLPPELMLLLPALSCLNLAVESAVAATAVDLLTEKGLVPWTCQQPAEAQNAPRAVPVFSPASAALQHQHQLSSSSLEGIEPVAHQIMWTA